LDGHSCLTERTHRFANAFKIWALGWQWDRFHAAAWQRRTKRGTELRVAIVQNIAAGMKTAPRLLLSPFDQSVPSILDLDVS
jgi:hypothetical protein